MQTPIVTFLTVVCLMGMMASADASSKKRPGKAGSTERAGWCAAKYTECTLDGEIYCDTKYKDTIIAHSACNAQKRRECADAYTDCNTLPQISQPGGVVTPPVRPGTVEPRPRTPSTAPLNKSGIGGAVRQRGVEGGPPASTPTEQEDKAPAQK
jgi:hypothetical protein